MTSFKNSKGKGALLQINIEEMIEKWCKIIILIKWEKQKKFNGIIHQQYSPKRKRQAMYFFSPFLF